MLLRDTLYTASRGVTANVRRSLLTMLGIIIGVGSVVLMTAVGASMEQVILGQISSLGANSMVIFPGTQEGGAGQVMTGFDSLTLEDVRALEQLTTVTSIAPVIFAPGPTTYAREQSYAQVFGVHPRFFRNQNITLKAGRFFDEADDSGARAVAILAPDAAEKLFGESDPIGQRVQIADRGYQVIGLTNPLGSQFFQNADDRVYIPFTTARHITGQRYVNFITMQSAGNFALAFDDVRSLLHQRHRINNPEGDESKDDFTVRSAEQANDILGAVSMGLTLFITTIAAISLVVGGIGIMNIMLVSVTERTREIGLRKAVGARKSDILLQFLIESVLLTVIGGFIGLVLGVSFAFVLARIVSQFLSSYVFAVSYLAMAVSMLMALATGLIFGISPARKAASFDPIDALRYE